MVWSERREVARRRGGGETRTELVESTRVEEVQRVCGCAGKEKGSVAEVAEEVRRAFETLRSATSTSKALRRRLRTSKGFRRLRISKLGLELLRSASKRTGWYRAGGWVDGQPVEAMTGAG